MNSHTLLLTTVLAVTSLGGCTHAIQMNPDLDALRGAEEERLDIAVAYYVSLSQNLEVVTSASGGGDSIKYYPYRDTETAMRTILSEKFRKVYALKSSIEDPLVAEKDIKYVFTPELQTSSKSDSAFFWPPTSFTVQLTCKAYSADGEELWSKQVTGYGTATKSEFQDNFSAAAHKASTDAFRRMRDQILAAEELR